MTADEAGGAAHGAARDSFAARLATEFAAGRHLCVGIDPHASVLDRWGLADTAAAAERMGREVIAAAAGHAACVKPQVAFFERFGQAGFAALERVLADARQTGVLVIADVKRGDIGSSVAAYADAWLAPGAPLECDAMTVAAYQGVGSLDGVFRRVRAHGKGAFVLAATSNAEAWQLQCAIRSDGRTVARAIVDEVRACNAGERLGSVGVVLGATLTLADFDIDIDKGVDRGSIYGDGDGNLAVPAVSSGAAADSSQFMLPVLAPGFGAQGARLEDAKQIFGRFSSALLANESRSILAAGRQGIAARIRARADVLRASLQ